jgi:mutator protein MutT
MIKMIVAAALVERDGRLLITRRQPGVHLEGLWEFPGGKCEPGETVAECLQRELHEELAVTALVDEERFVTCHTYYDRTVELHFLDCRVIGEPRPQLGQEMQWVRRGELSQFAFPPADAELIARLTREAAQEP